MSSNPFEGRKESQGAQFDPPEPTEEEKSFGDKAGARAADFGLKTLDLLLRGQYVSANIASNIVGALQGEEDFDLLDAAASGITGKRKGSYKEVAIQLGMKGDREGKFDLVDGVGLAGDVILDPVTYWSKGLTGLGHAAKAVSKAPKFAGAVNVARAIEEGSTPLARSVRGALATKKAQQLIAQEINPLKLGATAAERSALGQEALIGFRFPKATVPTLGRIARRTALGAGTGAAIGVVDPEHSPAELALLGAAMGAGLSPVEALKVSAKKMPGFLGRIPGPIELPIPKMGDIHKIPLPQKIEVGVFKGLSAADDFLRNAPGIGDIVHAGGKIFSQYHRPPSVDAQVWEQFTDEVRIFKNHRSGLTEDVFERLKELNLREDNSILGRLSGADFLSDVEKKAVFEALEAPARLQRKFGGPSIAEESLARIFRASKEDGDNWLKEVISDPNLNADRLERAFKFLEDRERVYGNALEVRRAQGIGPEDLEVQRLQEEFDEVQQLRSEMEGGGEPPVDPGPGPSGPAPPVKPTILTPLDELPSAPPTNGVDRTAFGPVGETMEKRAKVTKKLEDIEKKRVGINKMLKETTLESKQQGQEIQVMIKGLIDEKFEAEQLLKGIDASIKDEGAKAALLKRTEAKAKEQVAKLSKGPDATRPAIEALEEVQDEIAELQVLREAAVRAGKADDVSKLDAEIFHLQNETVADRASRLSSNAGDEATLLEGYMAESAGQRIGDEAKILDAETLVQEIGLPLERIEALGGIDTVNLARSATKATFEDTITRQGGDISGNLYETIRGEMGLRPEGDADALLRELGTSEQDLLDDVWEAVADKRTELLEKRPDIRMDMDNPRVVGPWAKGQQHGPVQIAIDYSGDLSPGEMDLILNHRPTSVIGEEVDIVVKSTKAGTAPKVPDPIQTVRGMERELRSVEESLRTGIHYKTGAPVQDAAALEAQANRLQVGIEDSYASMADDLRNDALNPGSRNPQSSIPDATNPSPQGRKTNLEAQHTAGASRLADVETEGALHDLHKEFPETSSPKAGGPSLREIVDTKNTLPEVPKKSPLTHFSPRKKSGEKVQQEGATSLRSQGEFDGKESFSEALREWKAKHKVTDNITPEELRKLPPIVRVLNGKKKNIVVRQENLVRGFSEPVIKDGKVIHFNVGDEVPLPGGGFGVVDEVIGDTRRIGKDVFEVDDLAEAQLEHVVDKNYSIVDHLEKFWQDERGFVDKGLLNSFVDKVFSRNPKIQKAFAEQFTDDIIRLKPEMHTKRQDVIDFLDALSAREADRGILNELIDFYMPHYRVSKSGWRNFFTELRAGNKPTFAYTRKIEDVVDEINKSLVETGRLPLFEENLLAALGMRGKASADAVSAHDFIANVTRKMGVPVDQISLSEFDAVKFMERMDYPMETVLEVEGKITAQHMIASEVLDMPVEKIKFLNSKMAKEIGDRFRAEPEKYAGLSTTFAQLEKDLAELVPEMGIFLPKGAVRKYRTLSVKKGGIPEEDLALLSVLNKAQLREGEFMVEIPLANLNEVTALTKMGVEAHLMPRQIAKEMNKTLGNMVTPSGEIDKFLKLTYDPIHNYWKNWTLHVFPEYHARNNLGNLWNMSLGDFDNPDYFLDAMKLKRMFTTGGEIDPAYRFTDGWGNQYSAQQLKTDMQNNRIMGAGQFTADIPQSVKSRMMDMRLTKNPLDYIPLMSQDANLWLRMGKWVGQQVEDTAHMAMYLDGLQKGYSPSVAARRTKKYLFDYEDITDAERQVFKRLSSFYTWSRKNFPLQIEGLVTRPGQFVSLGKAGNEVTQSLVPEENQPLVPKWMKELGPIPMTYDAENERAVYFLGGTWVPAGDLLRMFDPKMLAGGLLSPMVKAPLEIGFNHSLFFDGPIERGGYETGTFFNNRMRKKSIYAFKQIRLLSKFDKWLFNTDYSQSDAVRDFFIGRQYPVDFDEARYWDAWRLDREIGDIGRIIGKEKAKMEEDREAGRPVTDRHVRNLEEKLLQLQMERDALGKVVAQPGQNMRKPSRNPESKNNSDRDQFLRLMRERDNQ